MKTLYMVATLLAAMLIPLAAAEDAETTGAYIVTPASNDGKPHIAPLTQGTIIPGETDWHSLEVPPGKDNLWADLDWGDIDDSLTLTIYPPDGTVLGPYHDADDEKDDARIFLHMSRSLSPSSRPIVILPQWVQTLSGGAMVVFRVVY